MSKDEWKKLTKNEWKKWIVVVGRMLLAYALVFAPGVWAGQSQATKDKSGSPQKAAAQQANEKQSAGAAKAAAKTEQAQGEESENLVPEEKPSNDVSHQGIKVHGHWTIEIRNPDGTLVTHREFENSLTQSTGGSLLASLLKNQGQLPTVSLPGLPVMLPFYWAVILNFQKPGPCGNGVSGVECTIVQPSFVNIGNNYYQCLGGFPSDSTNLTPSVQIAGSPNASSLALNGTVVANFNSSITEVSTYALTPSTDLSACPPGVGAYIVNLNQFTDATISPIGVAAGQTIAVTVAISFS